MELDKVLFLDSETTGVPDRAAKWDIDFMQYPHIVQLAWIIGCKVESHIIRPDGWEIPQEAVDVHGITTEYALEHGEPFASVVDLLIQDCHEAEFDCGGSGNQICRRATGPDVPVGRHCPGKARKRPYFGRKNRK